MSVQTTFSRRTIWITVDKLGWIQEIKTRGPIVTPIQVPSRIVLKMVQNNRKVYEHNPENKHQKVLLTIQNFDKVKIWNEDGTVTITKNIIGEEPKADPIAEAIVNPFNKNKDSQQETTAQNAQVIATFKDVKKQEVVEKEEKVEVTESEEKNATEASDEAKDAAAVTEEKVETQKQNQQNSSKKKNKNK